MNPTLEFSNWGIIPYNDAWERQEKLFNERIDAKRNNRFMSNYLIICEHNPVYTLGKSGNIENMLLSEDMLKARGATLVHTNRGGDITFHGPGQLVGYPIIDIEQYHLSLHDYIYTLEEVIIKTIGEYGIKGQHDPTATGVWLDINNPAKKRKICAIGVKASHYVTMHGFALNVNTDLSYFTAINPCGFIHGRVASIAEEIKTMGSQHSIPSLEEVTQKLYHNFCTCFNSRL